MNLKLSDNPVLVGGLTVMSPVELINAINGILQLDSKTVFCDILLNLPIVCHVRGRRRAAATVGAWFGGLRMRQNASSKL